uniref:Uncharacterized protein n=1 Tax=Anguilla anguilla TaxID=7936 RepID=A0A0E9UHK6_ANGAN
MVWGRDCAAMGVALLLLRSPVLVLFSGVGHQPGNEGTH